MSLKKFTYQFSILFFLFIFYNCNYNPETSEWVDPVIIDGINIYPLNSLADEMRFKGTWTAPKINKNRKAYREIKAPGGEVFF